MLAGFPIASGAYTRKNLTNSDSGAPCSMRDELVAESYEYTLTSLLTGRVLALAGFFSAA